MWVKYIWRFITKMVNKMDNNHFNKLGLGTVQFGMHYGRFNSDGQPPIEEVTQILQEANQIGIQLLDTSPSYGESEIVLGKTLPEKHSFYIVTKTPIFKKTNLNANDISMIPRSFLNSLDNLKQNSIYGLLVHHADDLLTNGSENLFKEIQNLKDQKLVQKVGVSVYTKEQIVEVINRYPIDIVQIPINIFDQRLIQDGTLRWLKDRKIEIHARSIFLQGLLINKPDNIDSYFDYYKSHIRNYHRKLDKLGISPVQAALGFIKEIEEIDFMVVGVDTYRQFENIVYEYKKPWKPVSFEDDCIEVENIVNPSLWKVD